MTLVADSQETRASRARLTWEGECCIDAIHERKAELSSVLAADGDVELNLLGLHRIDTAGLQLLAAFVLELGQRGHVVHWRGVSNIVVEGARVTGLTALLGLAMTTAN